MNITDSNFSNINNRQFVELAKQVIELAEKTPQLIKLKAHCQEIANGRRKVISKKVIDDAFDVMETLIKDVCKTPDNILKVQKLVYRSIAYEMFIANNIQIN